MDLEIKKLESENKDKKVLFLLFKLHFKFS